MEIQAERNHQTKDIDQFRSENKKYLADMNRKINDGKIYHEQLTKEVNVLHESSPYQYIFPNSPVSFCRFDPRNYCYCCCMVY